MSMLWLSSHPWPLLSISLYYSDCIPRLISESDIILILFWLYSVAHISLTLFSGWYYSDCISNSIGWPYCFHSSVIRPISALCWWPWIRISSFPSTRQIRCTCITAAVWVSCPPMSSLLQTPATTTCGENSVTSAASSGESSLPSFTTPMFKGIFRFNTLSPFYGFVWYEILIIGAVSGINFFFYLLQNHLGLLQNG